MKKRLSYILLFACLASCVYPYDIELGSGENDHILVVDGEILTGGTSTIRLSYLTPLVQDYSNEEKPQAKAWIEDEDGNKYSGTKTLRDRFSIPMLNARPNKNYRAVIEADGETYVSDWQKPDYGPTVTDIYFDADRNFVTVHAQIESGLNDTGYAALTFEETWEFHSEFPAQIFVNTQTWAYEAIDYDYPYYWCFRNAESPERILVDYSRHLAGSWAYPVQRFARTNNRNHRRYSILVKVIALSEEAYNYNKQVQNQARSGSDLFSPEPGAMRGNLRCLSQPEKQVMGLVTAGNVSYKRAFLDSRYLINTRPNEASLHAVTLEEMPYLYYEQGERPIANIHVDGMGTTVGWGPERCINCVLAGGYQQKPSFWIW